MSNVKYSASSNVLKVNLSGAFIMKSRIIGIFDSNMKKVQDIKAKLRNVDKLVDVTSRSAAKSLIILDDGSGVLSPLAPLTLAKNLGLGGEP